MRIDSENRGLSRPRDGQTRPVISLESQAVPANIHTPKSKTALNVGMGMPLAPATDRQPGAALRRARIRAVGDIMFCQDQLACAERSGGDFHDQFEMISELLSDADFTAGNPEGTVGRYGDIPCSGYPRFNAPEAALAPLRDCGVDFLTLANNHMLDRWEGGVENTLNSVEKYGLGHVGAYRDQAERQRSVIREVNGIRFGFLAYTLGTNTMENRAVHPRAIELVPYLSMADFDGDVKRLRDAGAEVVIAFPHWGEEFLRQPDDSQRRYAAQLARAGVDIILGSHAHMVQPVDFQSVTVDGLEKQVLTAYCMGTFISDHVLRYTDSGVILDFTVSEQPDGRFTCERVGYIPTYTWKQDGRIRALPSGRYLERRPAGMDDRNYSRMVESYQEIVDVVGDQVRPIDG